MSAMSSEREWRHRSPPPPGPRSFKIMSWNILAPEYTYHCEESPLQIDKRVAIAVEEVRLRRPDLVALQEVSVNVFGLLRAGLGALGYDGVFDQKECAADGCAILWRVERYTLKSRHAYSFNVGSAVMLCGQVGQVVTLVEGGSAGGASAAGGASSEHLVVANTHLNFDTRRGDVKLGQALYFLDRIWERFLALAEELAPPAECRAPNGLEGQLFARTPALIVAGDWNTLPTSCLYQWLAHGRHDFAHCRDRSRVSDQMRMFANENLMAHHWRGGTGGTSTAHTYSSSSNSNNATHSKDVGGTTNSKETTAHWFHNVVPKEVIPHYVFLRPGAALWLGADQQLGLDADADSLCSCGEAVSEVSGSPVEEIVLCPHCKLLPEQLYHPFKLCSAYAEPARVRDASRDARQQQQEPPLTTEPAATVWQGRQKGCVDYIWYNRNELEVLRTLEVPRLKKLEIGGSIPNSDFPASDHFNLVAEMRFVPFEQRKRLFVAAVPRPQS